MNGSQETTDPGHSLDMEALLAGDTAAFEQMVRQETPRLFRIIRRMVDDSEEARDLVQETFLQALQRLDTFRREARFTTWLYAIGINLARAHLRRNKRFGTYDEAAIERMQPSFSGGSHVDAYEEWDPERAAERADLKHVVRDAVENLPSDYRTVITLRDLEQLPTSEVAELLGISPGAVRVRLHRARQALRSLLDDTMRRGA